MNYAGQLVRIKFMMEKLKDLANDGYIDNVWDLEFIESINARMQAGLPLTIRQIAKLEEVFEKN